MIEAPIVQQFWVAMDWYNTEFFPYSIIIPIIFTIGILGLVFYCFKKPDIRRSTYLKVFVALIYFVFGLTLLVALKPINYRLGLGMALGNWFMSFLFFAEAFWWKKIIFQLPQQKDLRYLSVLLMFTGIFLYTIVELMTGHSWPEIVLFGAGCPTTIFLNGLLISSLSRITNKWVLGIVFTYSVFVGGNWAWGGIAVDWLFFGSGIIGWAMLIRYWDRKE